MAEESNQNLNLGDNENENPEEIPQNDDVLEVDPEIIDQLDDSDDAGSYETIEEEEIKYQQQIIQEEILNPDSQMFDECECEFKLHTDSVYSISIHPKKSSIIASSGGDDKAMVWNIETAELVKKIENHSDSVIFSKFNCEGKMLATCGLDNYIYVFDTENNYENIQKLEGPSDELFFMEWHPSIPIVLICGGKDKMIWMFNAQNGNILQVYSGHEGPVSYANFCREGKLMYSISHDNSMRIWNPKTAKANVIQPKNPIKGELNCCACNDSSQLLIAGSTFGSIFIAHYKTLKVVCFFQVDEDSVEDVVFCEKFGLAIAASNKGKITIIDGSGNIRNTIKLISGITTLLHHPTENSILAGCMNGVIYVMDPRVGEIKQEYRAHDDIVLDITFDLSNKLLITASDDHKCKIFKYKSL